MEILKQNLELCMPGNVVCVQEDIGVFMNFLIMLHNISIDIVGQV